MEMKLIFAALLMSMIWATWSSQATVASRTLRHDEVSMEERHEQWMARYGRVYEDDAEKEMRLKIFKENVEFIEAFNEAAAIAGVSRPYQLGVNRFTDLTNQEFQASHNGYNKRRTSSSSSSSSSPKASKTSSFRYENVSAVPSSIDWRKTGAVTAIKDQGQCGCCWAFSAVAAIEGIHQLKTGKLISLSEQELVDCDTSDAGCEGGYMDTAFKFIKNNTGLTTEANYPYRGTETDGICNTSKETSRVATITGYEDVPANSESALLKAVTGQPVSVAIDAGGSEFQFYKSGVFTGDCGTELNHAVTAVGYGTSNDSTKYWLVKNSWGTSWGEKGYIRMQRDIHAAEGLCGIAMNASYPIA